MSRTKEATSAPKQSRDGGAPASASAKWELRLYVAGKTPRSVAALENLRRLCEEHLASRYTLEVIDLIVHPHLAKGDEIVAIPTLIRKLPEPIRRIIGDMSNVERTLVGLQLRPSVV